VIFFLVIWS